MSKVVIKEGYTMWTSYFKKEYLEEIRKRALKESHTLSFMVNKIIEKGLERDELD